MTTGRIARTVIGSLGFLASVAVFVVRSTVLDRQITTLEVSMHVVILLMSYMMFDPAVGKALVGKLIDKIPFGG